MCPRCPKEKTHTVKVYSYRVKWGMADIVDSFFKADQNVLSSEPKYFFSILGSYHIKKLYFVSLQGEQTISKFCSEPLGPP